MSEKIIKDSGSKREFGTGSHRDAKPVGKGDMVLIPACAVIRAEKALNYIDDENVGKECLKEFLKDAMVAAMHYLNKDTDEDWLAIAAANTLLAAGLSERKEVVEEYDIDDPCNLWSLLGSGLIALSKHYEGGALKYGRNNWQLGQPLSVLMDSGLRHISKAMAGIEDEPHIRAAAWNFMGAIWMLENKPEMNDL
jgi:hypothetical protein